MPLELEHVVKDHLDRQIQAAEEADMSLPQFLYDKKIDFDTEPSAMFINDLRAYHPNREIKGT